MHWASCDDASSSVLLNSCPGSRGMAGGDLDVLCPDVYVEGLKQYIILKDMSSYKTNPR